MVFWLLCGNFNSAAQLDLEFGAYYTHVNGCWCSCGDMLPFVCYLQWKWCVTSQWFSHATTVYCQNIGQPLIGHISPSSAPNWELETVLESSWRELSSGVLANEHSIYSGPVMARQSWCIHQALTKQPIFCGENELGRHFTHKHTHFVDMSAHFTMSHKWPCPSTSPNHGATWHKQVLHPMPNLEWQLHVMLRWVT